MSVKNPSENGKGSYASKAIDKLRKTVENIYTSGLAGIGVAGGATIVTGWEIGASAGAVAALSIYGFNKLIGDRNEW